MCRQLTPWEEAVQFHGHACPGLAMGVRASQIALEKLGVERAEDEELIAIAETDGCGVDGVQVITACTLGKGNLFLKDYGKQVYTIASRKTGQGVRVYFKPFDFSAAEKDLRKKVFAGEATPEEQKEFKKMQEKLIDHILNSTAEEICDVQVKKVELPGKARIFQSVRCEKCGEYFMEPRARFQDGKIVCLECFEDYNRQI
ncbi:MAG: formylmethanofuran dehydrogenase subunit [Clostridia bacterium]|jgi:formylmethanofuran dehydrogenase subunit E|nr:formylmethanofuran dehydrogenase subunit region [Clostridiales bacterium]MDK2985054.1 formylmethanofuran dehydrogenase subunit [Clostridia bacterium]